MQPFLSLPIDMPLAHDVEFVEERLVGGRRVTCRSRRWMRLNKPIDGAAQVIGHQVSVPLAGLHVFRPINSTMALAETSLLASPVPKKCRYEWAWTWATPALRAQMLTKPLTETSLGPNTESSRPSERTVLGAPWSKTKAAKTDAKQPKE